MSMRELRLGSAFNLDIVNLQPNYGLDKMFNIN